MIPPPAARARVGVLVSGRGSNMLALADAAGAPDCPYEIVLVAANDPEAPGLAAAAARGIPTWGLSHKGLPRSGFDRLVDTALTEARVEWVALAGYMRLLSSDFVSAWAGRMLNIHPSLLPRHKGLDTHARALAAGDTVHGATVHLVTAALDDGPVLARAEVPVLADDTAETLAARVLAAEHRLYPPTLAAFVTGRIGPDRPLSRRYPPA